MSCRTRSRCAPATRLLVVVFVFGMLAAACGGDDSAADVAADDDTDVAPAEDDTQDGANGSGNCPAEPFAGELSRTASPDLGHTDVAVADDELMDAAAFELGAGFQYTVYVATYPIDDADMGSTLTAQPGEVLVTFAARGNDGERIEPGVVYDESFVIIDSGGGAENRPVDPTGTVEFIALADDHICLKIDFVDENQTMTGTVSARIPSSR